MKINDVDVSGVASHDEMARIFREERLNNPLEVRIQVEKAPSDGSRSPAGSIGSAARGGDEEDDAEVSLRTAGTRGQAIAQQQVPAGRRRKRTSDEALCAACNEEPLLTEGCWHRCRTCRGRIHGPGMCKVVQRWADDDVLFCSEECKNPEDAGPHKPSGGPQKPSVTGAKRGRKGEEKGNKAVKTAKKPRGGEKTRHGGDESDENEWGDHFKVDVRTQRTRGGNAHEEGSQQASSPSEEVNDMFA